MTKTCVVCKKFFIRGDDSRSFHKFPRDNDQRQKWISVFRLVNVPKTATICSDHFDEKSFHQTDGYTRVKRLLSNAVPSIINVSSACVNYENGTVKIEQDQRDETVVHLSNCRPPMNAYPTDKHTSDIKSMCEANDSYNEHNVHEKPVTLVMHSKNTQMHSNVLDENLCSMFNNAGFENNNLSRKRSVTVTISDVPLKKQKVEQEANSEFKNIKIGFMDGYERKYISREDFVSDEAWQRFLRYKICKESQNEAVRKKKSRAQKKINNFQELVKSLKEIFR